MPLLRYATPLLLCCAGLIPLSSDTPPARIAAPLIRPQAQEGADATLSPYFFMPYTAERVEPGKT